MRHFLLTWKVLALCESQPVTTPKLRHALNNRTFIQKQQHRKSTGKNVLLFFSFFFFFFLCFVLQNRQPRDLQTTLYKSWLRSFKYLFFNSLETVYFTKTDGLGKVGVNSTESLNHIGKKPVYVLNLHLSPALILLIVIVPRVMCLVHHLESTPTLWYSVWIQRVRSRSTC